MSSRTNVVAGRSVLVVLAVLVGAASIAPGGQGRTQGPDFFYVDGIHGNDNNNGFLPGTAFATIQRAIDTAPDGGIILVYPGLYRGEVDFQGKAVVVQGVVSGKAGIPILHNPGDFAVSFYSGEGPESVLSNFVIKGSFMAVFIAGSSPTISQLTVVDNTY